MSSQKGVSSLIIIVGVLLIIGLGAGYFYTTLKPNSSNPVSVKEEVPAPSTKEPDNVVSLTQSEIDDSITSLDTSSWKTYENKKFGYSIQYPDNWFMDILGKDINFQTETSEAVTFGRYQMPRNMEDLDYQQKTNEFVKLAYYVEVSASESTGDLDSIADTVDAFKHHKDYRKEKITFNNLPAYKITHDESILSNDFFLVKTETHLYIIRLGYNYPNLTLKKKSQEIHDKIISSLKFQN